MTAPTRERCDRCHSKSAMLAPDGYTDCSACGKTTRPRPASKRQQELDQLRARQRAKATQQRRLPL